MLIIIIPNKKILKINIATFLYLINFKLSINTNFYLIANRNNNELLCTNILITEKKLLKHLFMIINKSKLLYHINQLISVH